MLPTHHPANLDSYRPRTLRPHTPRFATGMSLVLLFGACAGQPKPPSNEPLCVVADAPAAAPVGVIRRTDLLVAYYNSQRHADYLNGLLKQRDEAKAAGDRARVRAIDREGQAQQDLAHKQLMGRAPLTNILEAIRDDLDHVVQELGVGTVLESGAFIRPGTRTIDLTDDLVKRLPKAR